MLTDIDLRETVASISEEYFNRNLSDNVIVSFTNRYRRAVGCTYFDLRDGHYHLAFNYQQFEAGYPEVILIGVIKHELCHLYLEPKHLKRAHGRVFRHLLKSVHGIYIVPDILQHYHDDKPIYAYQCQKCGHISYYGYPTANDDWLCRCTGDLKLIGKISKRTFLKAFLHKEYTKPNNRMPQVKHIEPLQQKQMSLF